MWVTVAAVSLVRRWKVAWEPVEPCVHGGDTRVWYQVRLVRITPLRPTPRAPHLRNLLLVGSLALRTVRCNLLLRLRLGLPEAVLLGCAGGIG